MHPQNGKRVGSGLHPWSTTCVVAAATTRGGVTLAR
jgi:hypothetical protein